MKCTIFGAGAWGTAIAIHCARTGHNTTLVPRRQEHADALSKDRVNSDYLPNQPLPDNITITANPQDALSGADIVFLACPSKALRSLCQSIQPLYDKSSTKAFLTLCKGLELDSLLPPVSVATQILPKDLCGTLSGPTFAGEVASGKPAALVLAMEHSSPHAQAIQESLSNHQFRVYTSTDLLGVELAGCLKNVYAIGGGICDGFDLGDNAKAAFLTRALHELVKLGTTLGGQPSTFYGLSGFGDLIATCNGPWSRNRTFGENLAKGGGVQSLLQNRKTVVEGYWATQAFHNLLKSKNALNLAPILQAIYSVLYENVEPTEAVTTLMTRQLKTEG